MSLLNLLLLFIALGRKHIETDRVRRLLKSAMIIGAVYWVIIGVMVSLMGTDPKLFGAGPLNFEIVVKTITTFMFYRAFQITAINRERKWTAALLIIALLDIIAIAVGYFID